MSTLDTELAEMLSQIVGSAAVGEADPAVVMVAPKPEEQPVEQKYVPVKTEAAPTITAEQVAKIAEVKASLETSNRRPVDDGKVQINGCPLAKTTVYSRGYVRFDFSGWNKAAFYMSDLEAFKGWLNSEQYTNWKAEAERMGFRG